MLYAGYMGVVIWIAYNATLRQNHQLQEDLTSVQRQEQFYEGIVRTEQAQIEAQQEAKRKKTEFVSSEIKCLADATYYEAAQEPAEGQLAVATVVMNRVSNPQYPHTVCGVVYQRHTKADKIVCAFSWTCQPRHGIVARLYRPIMAMVKSVYLRRQRSEDVGSATLFHGTYIHPDWADRASLVTTIGAHAFYSE
jgi:spore germination cell wall hydrolase CwlJ-like protein